MNSSTSEVLWPSPVCARARASTITTTQSIFSSAVSVAINTAIAAGLFTASIATGATPSADVQWVLAMLNQGGYQASVTGANLVVSW